MALNINEVFVRNMKRYMELRGMSQSELARRGSIPQATVSRVANTVENDQFPRLDTVAAIARGLGVPIADLLASDETVIADPSALPRLPDTPHHLARQIARLVEDFILSDDAHRIELLRRAEQFANKS